MPSDDQSLKDLLKNRTLQYQMAIKDAVSPALDKMADSWEKFTTAFEHAEKSADKAIDSVASDVQDLSKKKLPGMSSAVEEVVEALDNIDESTRFQALDTALQRIKEGFDKLSSNAVTSQVTNTAQSMSEMALQAGKSLRLSREQAISLRDAVLASTPGISRMAISLQDRGEAMVALIEAGARAPEQIAKLAPLVALTAAATKQSADTVAQAHYALDDQLGLSAESINNIMAVYAQASGDMAVSFDTLSSGVISNAGKLTTAFVGVSEAGREQIIVSLGSLRAALENQWAGGEQFLTGVMSAISDPASEAAQQLTSLSGLTAYEWRNALQTADGAEYAIGATIRKLQELGATQPEVVSAFETMYGLAEGSFVKLTGSGDAIMQNMSQLGASVEAVKPSLQYLNRQATENVSWFSKLGNAISYVAAKELPLLGFSAMDVGGVLADVGTSAADVSTWALSGSMLISTFVKDAGRGTTAFASWMTMAGDQTRSWGLTSVSSFITVAGQYATYLWARMTGATVEASLAAASRVTDKAAITSKLAVASANGVLTASNATTATSTAAVSAANLTAIPTFHGMASAALVAAKATLLAVAPYVAIGAAIAALGYGVYYAATNWDKFTSAVWDAFVTFTPLGMIIKYFLKDIKWLGRGLADIASTMYHLMKVVLLPLQVVLYGVWKLFKSVFVSTSLVPFTKGLEQVSAIIGVISTGLGYAGKAARFIGRIARGVGRTVLDAIKYLMNGAISAINKVINHPIAGLDKTWGSVYGLTSIPLLAHGGLVTAPTLAMVGEKGPEVVVPLHEFMAMVSPALSGLSAATSSLGGAVSRSSRAPSVPSKVTLDQAQVVAVLREFMSLVERVSLRGKTRNVLSSSGWGQSSAPFMNESGV